MKNAQKPLARGEHRAEKPQPPIQPPLTEPPDGALTREHNASAIDETIRLELLDYKRKHRLSNLALAKKLGYPSGTIVSRYLNSRPYAGDYLRLQANAADMLRASKVKLAPSGGTATDRDTRDLWSTAVARSVSGILEVIRRTNDFALIHGPAGVGKTCSLALYAELNPATLLITAAEKCADPGALIRAMVQHERLNVSQRERRVDALLDRFKGSDRLIIIDNAQRLQVTALKWLFDFHDATKCPVAMVGNPDVLDKIRPSDQFFSRIGLAEAVNIGEIKEAEEFARAMVAKIDPELVGELGAEATERIMRPGHARSLSKQLNLTRVLMETPEFAGQPRKAFAAAAGKLVLMGGASK